jgi:hypothetical protein
VVLPDVFTAENLLDLYQLRFCPVAAGDVAQVAFDTAGQQEGETILGWHSRLRDTFVLAHPGQEAGLETNTVVMRKFILGLTSIKAREQTYKRRPETYTACLAEASTETAGNSILMQTALNAGPPRKAFKTEPGILAMNVQQQGDNPLQEAYAAAIRQGMVGAMHEGEVDNRTCFFCEQTGHLKADCRIYLKTQKAPWAPYPAQGGGQNGGQNGGGGGGRGARGQNRGRGGGGRGRGRGRGGRPAVHAVQEQGEDHQGPEPASGNY